MVTKLAGGGGSREGEVGFTRDYNNQGVTIGWEANFPGQVFNFHIKVSMIMFESPEGAVTPNF